MALIGVTRVEYVGQPIHIGVIRVEYVGQPIV
jgi:hypothetical protein